MGLWKAPSAKERESKGGGGKIPQTNGARNIAAVQYLFPWPSARSAILQSGLLILSIS
jgi:hypothetical protein